MNSGAISVEQDACSPSIVAAFSGLFACEVEIGFGLVERLNFSQNARSRAR